MKKRGHSHTTLKATIGITIMLLALAGLCVWLWPTLEALLLILLLAFGF